MSEDAAPREHAPTRRFVLVARDGALLSAALHEPVTPPRAAVVILGATAVPRGFYDRFARHLADRGFRVLSFDYRGIGGSRPESLRGFHASMRDWAELDAGAAIERARAISPGLPVFAVGHSFGGHVIGLRSKMDDVDAMVLVGSQLPHWKHWRGVNRLEVAAFWYGMVPFFSTVLGYVPGFAGVDQDLPADAARDWARWGSHPDYFVGHVDGAADRLAKFAAPVLAFSFTDDWYAPKESTRSLLSRLTSAKIRHRRVHPSELGQDAVGHFGFFRPKLAAPLWAEVTRFFDEALGEEALTPPPSSLESGVLADLAFGRD